MKCRLTYLILFVVVMLAIPGAAFSQEFRNMELNAFVAGSAHTKNNYQIGFPQSITPINGQFKLNDALRGGIRYNVNTTGHWGEELFFSYEPNKAVFIRKTAPTQQQNFDIRIFNFGVNAMYYLYEQEDRATQPFLSFGLGGTMYRPTALAKQIANDPLQGNIIGFTSSKWLALNYGIGFKQRITKRLGARMDVRAFHTRNPSFGLPRSSADPSAVVFPATGAIHNMEVSAGLIIRIKK